MDDHRKPYRDDPSLRRMQTENFSMQRTRPDGHRPQSRFWDTVLSKETPSSLHPQPHSTSHPHVHPHSHSNSHSPSHSHSTHPHSASSQTTMLGMSSQTRNDSASLRHYQSQSFHVPDQHHIPQMSQPEASTRTKGFRCDTCNVAFSQKSHLTQHIKTVHEKIRPYKCDYCTRAFGKRYDLISHVEAVHKKHRPHACTFCDKQFAKRSNLTRHVDHMHGDKHRKNMSSK